MQQTIWRRVMWASRWVGDVYKIQLRVQVTRIQRRLDTRAYGAHTQEPGSAPASTIVCAYCQLYAVCGRVVHTSRLALRVAGRTIASDMCEILNKVHDQLEGELRSKDGSFECIDVHSRIVNIV